MTAGVGIFDSEFLRPLPGLKLLPGSRLLPSELAVPLVPLVPFEAPFMLLLLLLLLSSGFECRFFGRNTVYLDLSSS